MSPWAGATGSGVMTRGGAGVGVGDRVGVVAGVGDGVGEDVGVGEGVAVGDGVGVLVEVGESVGIRLTVRVGVSVGVAGCRLCGVDVGAIVVVVRVGELQDKLDSIAKAARPTMTGRAAGMEVRVIPKRSMMIPRSLPQFQRNGFISLPRGQSNA